MQEDGRLDTSFQLNVKETSQLLTLVINGTITAEMQGTASKNLLQNIYYNTSQFFEGATDYEPLPAITVLNSADIRLFPVSDRIALEYNDNILLKFTPSISLLVSVFEGIGEYIRGTATA